ncbi:hypothetical protein SAMN00790413_05234 [Deinococcus hopiensis KR-140]|uniref:Uncharacterized protein n=1 Tax=Deinococcus hopiensis KR-140 TaxID=695939 RepID=A0A1W1UU29_9DEIO|nr:hypothetical protein SAMN00790413_05234 [Deinococcus hopiensis KR-140]
MPNGQKFNHGKKNCVEREWDPYERRDWSSAQHSVNEQVKYQQAYDGCHDADKPQGESHCVPWALDNPHTYQEEGQTHKVQRSKFGRHGTGVRHFFLARGGVSQRRICASFYGWRYVVTASLSDRLATFMRMRTAYAEKLSEYLSRQQREAA